MATFTVHTPPNIDSKLSVADRTIFIREGFSWVAFLFPMIWLLWHRMWSFFLIYLIYMMASSIAYLFISETLVLFAFACVSILFALEANQLRRWILHHRGWKFAGIVSGRNREEYETKFFGNRTQHVQDEVRSEQENMAETAVDRQNLDNPQYHEGVLGLFPTPTVRQ